MPRKGKERSIKKEENIKRAKLMTKRGIKGKETWHFSNYDKSKATTTKRNGRNWQELTKPKARNYIFGQRWQAIGFYTKVKELTIANLYHLAANHVKLGVFGSDEQSKHKQILIVD